MPGRSAEALDAPCRLDDFAQTAFEDNDRSASPGGPDLAELGLNAAAAGPNLRRMLSRSPGTACEVCTGVLSGGPPPWAAPAGSSCRSHCTAR